MTVNMQKALLNLILFKTPSPLQEMLLYIRRMRQPFLSPLFQKNCIRIVICYVWFTQSIRWIIVPTDVFYYNTV